MFWVKTTHKIDVFERIFLFFRRKNSRYIDNNTRKKLFVFQRIIYNSCNTYTVDSIDVWWKYPRNGNQSIKNSGQSSGKTQRLPIIGILN